MNIKYVGLSQCNVHSAIPKMNISTNNKSKESIKNDDTAATVNISKTGKQMDKNQKNVRFHNNSTSDSQYNSEDSLDELRNIIDTLKSGKTLSTEEQKVLNNELEEIANKQYDHAKNLKLSPTDERVLKELQEHYLMKLHALQDLKDQLKNEKLAQDIEATNAHQTQDMHETKEKKELIESLLDVEDDDNAKAKEDTEEKEEADANKLQDNENDISNVKRTLKEAAVNQENLDHLNSSKVNAVKNKMENDALLDKEYVDTVDMLKNPEFSTLEKVKKVEQFISISTEVAVTREINKHVALFNHRAIVDLKSAIRSIGFVSLSEFMMGKNANSAIGRDFVNKF